MTNRICTPELGVILNKRITARLNWVHYVSAGIEPPEPDNPLFDMENVILSPHVAGGGSTGYARRKDIFAENLRRFRLGEPLFTPCRPGVRNSRSRLRAVVPVRPSAIFRQFEPHGVEDRKSAGEAQSQDPTEIPHRLDAPQ